MGGIGYGLVHISGLSYIHVRTGTNQHRVARIALSYLSLAIGMVSSVHYMSGRWRWTHGYSEFGYFMMYSSASILACFILNELFHGLGLYNYKKCLDPEVHEADQQRDRLMRGLRKHGHFPNPCKQFGLSFMATMSKGLNGFLFSNIFLFLTMYEQQWQFPRLEFIPYYFILGGIIFGIIVSLSVRIKHFYPGTLLFQSIFIVLVGFLYRNSEHSAVFFWIFYAIAATGCFVPDVTIMEVSKPGMYELNLFMGFLFEQVPIIVSLYYVHDVPYYVLYESAAMWSNIIVYVVLSLFVGIVMLITYPDTFRKNILEMQRMIMNKASGLPQTVQGTQSGQHVGVYPSLAQYVPAPAPIPTQSGMFSTQPMFPGQQPVYMVPAQQYPSYSGVGSMPMQAPITVTAATATSHTTQQVVETKSSSSPSAPQLTPNGELWEQLPPSYYSAAHLDQPNRS